MYAIFSKGSHQYMVQEGQVLEVQLQDLPDDATTVAFDQVLLLGGTEGGPKIGSPLVTGAKVTATVLGEFKAAKIIIQKFRRRKNYRRRQGHRQRYLRVRVDKIEG